jgi:predicted nucleic acid-binding protein
LEKYIKEFSIPQALKYKDCVAFVKNKARFLEDLDDGETEAIQLYSEMNADLLLIEDKDTRAFAESQGISCMGTPAS